MGPLWGPEHRVTGAVPDWEGTIFLSWNQSSPKMILAEGNLNASVNTMLEQSSLQYWPDKV